MVTLKPRHNSVVVRRQKQLGTIFIPENANSKNAIVEVMEVGEDEELNDIQVGDTVVVEHLNEDSKIHDSYLVYNENIIAKLVEA